jgi:hypothetical protein
MKQNRRKLQKHSGRYFFTKMIRQLDMYGHPINLAFKGETTHKTLLGGVFTILANVIIVSFFIYQVLSVL